MEPSLAVDMKPSFERSGYLGPLPFLTPAECMLLQNYVRNGELAAPRIWSKDLATQDPLIYGVATRPRLLGWLERLLGPDVFLWGAQLIEKGPGESHPWHTDIETSSPAGRFVSVWIGIENASAGSALQYIGGSHLIGKSLQQVAHEKGVERPDRTAERSLAWAKEVRPDASLVAADVKDGDAVLFDGRIWHGSLNSESKPRRALLLQFAQARQAVQIPDLDKTKNWPFAYKDKPPPAITVLGRAKGYSNLVAPPEDKRLDDPVIAPIKPVADGKAWTPHPLIKGRTTAAGRLSIHYSVLQPGYSPHEPHVHIEEEILIVIDGEADVVLPTGPSDAAPAVERLKRGDFAYYPPYRWHTIRNSSRTPIVYLMMKWSGAPQGLGRHLEGGVFRDDGMPGAASEPFQSKLVYEGATHFLTKLHAHRSVLSQGGGYQPHADAHDVMIVLLEGEVSTMGKTIAAPAFFYHPAGTLHGIRGLGEIPARYLVVEMHGVPQAEARDWTPMEWSMSADFKIRFALIDRNANVVS